MTIARPLHGEPGAAPSPAEGAGPATASELLPQIKAAIAARRFDRAVGLLRSAIDPTLDFTVALALHRHLQRLRAEVPAAKVIKLALVSSFTATQLKPLVELFLFAGGIRADIYVPDYGLMRQEVLDPHSQLFAERPATVILATSWRDLVHRPSPGQKRDATDRMVTAEVGQWSAMWETIHGRLGGQVIQNNFDAPPWRALDNLETRDPAGLGYFIARVNIALQDAAPPFVTIHDLDHLAAAHGRWIWNDEHYFHLAKIPCAPECQVDYAHSLASLIIAQEGLSKKCLVLDLDNTLWGGVIGDDGVGGIRLGQGDAEGEAFLAFQRYAKALRARGVLLAVCSKNEHAIAKEAFDKHPEMVLTYDDISCFVANWSDKATNLREIARRLNIGLNSLVLVDDNPAERLLVRQMAPEVAVPELTNDPAEYVRCLERHRYFQTVSISDEDYQRAEYYRANAAREAAQEAAGGLEDFLKSLNMVARVAPIGSTSLERSTQLINKSNQFNLTTRRYTSGEILAITADPAWITLTVSLADRFGDNGLISVLMARLDGDAIDIDTWVMSCRVLKRRVENMLLDELCDLATNRGLRKIRGTYIPTPKNALVADHYPGLGFGPAPMTGAVAHDGRTLWELTLAGRTPLPTFIEVCRNG